jgi:hypothetical protein
MPELSVILPTRNPSPARLRSTLEGLAAQTLRHDRWELLLVDNASDRAWEPPAGLAAALPDFRRINEPEIGLTLARLRGIVETRGDLLVFVDDDNVLVPGYLTAATQRFEEYPRLGAAGGPVTPKFEATPPAWTREFWALLALHEHGERPLIQAGGPGTAWPAFAPVGAGLCVRRSAVTPYLEALQRDPSRRHLDRRGAALSSGGDNDLVFTMLHAGSDIGYFPELRVTHLIPPGRLTPDYLARLNEGIQRTWVRVLALHGQCPWPVIPRWTVPLRVARVWWRDRAWTSPSAQVRWRGHVGRFYGQADLGTEPVRIHA